MLRHPDILIEILRHLKTPQALIMMSCVSRQTRKLVAAAWAECARQVCGDMLPLPPSTPHADDAAYIAKLRMCPWLSQPVTYRFDRKAEEMHRRMELREVRDVSMGDAEVSVLLAFAHGDETILRAMVCPLIPRFPCMTVRFRVDHTPGAPQCQALYDPAMKQLLDTGLLPEELLEILCIAGPTTIRVVPLHRSAVAVFSGRDNISDVYIYDAQCTRLLRRLRTPRDALRLEVVCRGPVLVVVTDTRISTYAPSVERAFRLRSVHPA